MTEENTQKQRILVISNDNRFIREVPELSTVLPVKLTVQKGSYEALQTLRSKPANLVILDFNIPLISGEELIRLVHEAHPDTPIIVITDPLTSEQKKEIIDAGAMDFMERPFEFEELKSKVQNLMFTKTYHFQVAALRTTLKKEYGLENIIGDCDEMWKVYRALGNIAKSDVTVFIQGESGTGKEVIARTIHKKSRRRNHPLITINCAAIPENLLESELFGHEKGAFSGAVSQRIGKFELANDGTIFLDEIGEMSFVLQAKILRLLEEQEFERVGGNKSIKVDVRIISATNKNLDKEVTASRFREDLLYRIKVYPIYLPPLKDRAEDIPLLVYHFIDLLSTKNQKEVLGINENALTLLASYRWPGNIRELENVLERAILNCAGKVLTVNDIDIDTGSVDEIDSKNENFSDGDAVIREYGVPVDNGTAAVKSVLPLKTVEKMAIEHALRINEGNVSLSAEQLKIGRATLHRKIKEYEIDINKLR
ncbi:sigma-54-dependent transcriptional regulator [candidate division KSB1 bacterium]